MQHDRRARPTIAVLRTLEAGWENPWPRRQVDEGRWENLHPLAELPHPALRKAREQFGSDPADDLPWGLIECSGEYRMQEVRMSQWRAAVWEDTNGVRWIVAVGLAKGGHDDNDDFYADLERHLTGTGSSTVFPTALDARLLKRETAAGRITAWELRVQEAAADLLEHAVADGEAVADLPSLRTDGRLARVRVTWVQNRDDYAWEDLVVEVEDPTSPGSRELWAMSQRIMISLSQPVQTWDPDSDERFSTMNDPGHALSQLARLRTAIARNELLAPEPGRVSHFTHRRHITKAGVDGDALRALCGVFFVPTQDPGGMPQCPHCADAYAELPAVPA